MSKRHQYLDLAEFERQDFIGKGGFSEVFKIQEIKTGKVLAAKISIKRLNGNTKEIKQLKINLTREVNIISQLKNPCILKYIGFSPTDFNEEPKPVIVTQYYKNGSLERIINLNRLGLAPKAWNDTKKLINIYGIASGVSYLHSRDILHRDLKPQNILEDDNLFPAIADFGIAQISHQKQDGTVYQPNTKAMGTPIYIAPEIWKKNAYSTAGDVYSFSLIVYEIITNEIPMKGYSQDKIFEEVIQNRGRPEFKSPIPDSYRQLIEQCWVDNPIERPSFDAILRQLKNDPGFITKNVNKEEFFDYVEYIDQFHSSDNQNQQIFQIDEIRKQRKIRAIEMKKEAVRKELERIEQEKKELEKKELEKANEERELQANILKEQQSQSHSQSEYESGSQPRGIPKSESSSPQKTQTNASTIKRTKKKKKTVSKPKNVPLSDIPGFLDLSEDTQQFIKQSVDQQKLKPKQIIIYSANIVAMFQNGTLNSPSFVKFLDYFDDISIELPYPSNFFELLLYHVSNIKKKDLPKIKINVIISGISSIPNSAFYGCSLVSKIIIPSTVKTIEKDAFHGCSSLSYMAIPSSVESIGEHAFYGCSSLKQISIPSTIKSIGRDCFYGCYSL